MDVLMSIINQKRVDNQWTSCAAYPIFQQKGTKNQHKGTENQHKALKTNTKALKANTMALKTNTEALKISQLKYHQKKSNVKSARRDETKKHFFKKSSELPQQEIVVAQISIYGKLDNVL
jgi:hypothetical protein